MTIIVPVQYELEDGEFIFGLAADLIYSPWTDRINTAVMSRCVKFSTLDERKLG